MSESFLSRHPVLRRLLHLRMADWVIFALLLWGAVALIAPHQLEVSLYKLALVALAAITGWWIDRSLFPYARPETFFTLTRPDADVRSGGETTFTDLVGALSFSETETAADLQGTDSTQLLNLARTAMLRRAGIVAATMIAVGLGA